MISLDYKAAKSIHPRASNLFSVGGMSVARIALIGENSTSYVRELIDIWNSGDCAVLIDWRTPISTAIELMSEAGVSECRIEKEIYNKVSKFESNNIAFVTFEMENRAELLPQYIYDSFKENYSTSEAVIIYSSGTTGKAKGIILSHYAINTNADAIIDYMRPQKTDCMYIVKSLSHSSTLTGELLVALKSGMKVLMGPTILPPRCIFNNISKHNVSVLCVNPTLLSMYAQEYEPTKYNLSTLKVIYVSGSILNDKTYNLAHNVFENIPIYNVYGLSEAGPRVTAQRIDCCKGNSVGKPIKFVKLVIVDKNGSALKNGESGVVHVNTPCRFSGYISGEDKNKSLYKNWLNTGDIGYFDYNNELHIIDRQDDVIIIDSHKIYPSEIEKQIVNNTAIQECVVIKNKVNDKEFIVCLYTGDYLEEKFLKEKLKNFLLPYEIPRRFVHTNSIPRTNNGKISKTDVKQIIENILVE